MEGYSRDYREGAYQEIFFIQSYGINRINEADDSVKAKSVEKEVN